MRNLSYFTKKAQQQVDQSVVAAVPAKVREISGGDVVADTLAGFTLLAVPLIAVAELMGRRKLDTVSRKRDRYGNVMITFTNDSIAIHEFRVVTRRVGKQLETHPLDGVSYTRSEEFLDTRLHIDGTAWRVDGWFERDLRAAIGPLGVKLGSLTQPT